MDRKIVNEAYKVRSISFLEKKKKMLVHQKFRDKLTKPMTWNTEVTGVCLLEKNARPHTAVCTTRTLLEMFGWGIFHHPPYSPDLAPCYYYLCLHLKRFFWRSESGGS